MASLTLSDIQNTTSTGTRAVLLEPVLLTLGGGRMRFRGIERVATPDGQAAVVQEWMVEVLAN